MKLKRVHLKRTSINKLGERKFDSGKKLFAKDPNSAQLNLFLSMVFLTVSFSYGEETQPEVVKTSTLELNPTLELMF